MRRFLPLLHGIRGRLVLLLVVVLVPVVLVEAVLHRQRYEAQRTQELQANLEVARAVGKAFEAFLQDIVHSQLVLGTALTASRTMAGSDRDRLLAAFERDNPTVRSAFWMTPEGVVVASGLRASIGLDLRDRSFVRAVVAGQRWAVSERIVGRATREPTFTIASGIRDGAGRLLGIVGTSIEPERLASVLAIERSAGAGIVLVDHTGMLVCRFPPLAYSEEQRNFLQRYPAIGEALRGRDVLAVVQGTATADTRLAAFTPIPSIGWVAAASRIEEAALGTGASRPLLEVALMLGIALLGTAVAAALARPMVRAVDALRTRALALSRGETVQVDPVSGPAELAELAAVFDQMATTVQTREAAHKASEALLRAITDTSPDAIYVKDRQSRWLLANPALLRIVGRTAAEVLGKTDRELYTDPSIGEAIVENDRQVLERGQPEVFEEVADTPDGRRTFLSIKAPRRDPAGAAIGLVGISHDITVRKRAEEELTRARNTLAEAQAIAQLGSFEYVAATRTTVWSEQEYRIYGLDPAGPSPEYGTMLAQCIHPEDAALLHETFTQAMADRSVYNLEHRIVRPDGSVRWVHDRAHPHLDKEGSLLGYIGATLDITERKLATQQLARSEALLRAVLDGSPEPIFLKDCESRLLLANPATFTVIGKPAEACLGKTDEQYYEHPADGRAIMANDRRILASGQTETVEESVTTPSGPRHYLSTKAPYRDASGATLGLIGVARDITARKQAETALQDLNATLEQRVRERTADLARQADQLRALAVELTLAEQRERQRLAQVLHDEHQQLLVAAKLRATILGRDADPAVREASRETAAILQEAIENARALTRDLSPPVLQQGALVPALAWLTTWMQEKHRLAITLDADSAAIPANEETALLLYQAVRELLLNVVKHARVDAARLTVSREGGQVRIEVVDAGMGFDPAGLRAGGGAARGFGLFTLEQRLPLFGCRLAIESVPGQGSRITLWAPLQPPAPDAAPPADLPPAAGPAAPPTATRRLRVLLVDDHAIVRQTLARLLDAEPDFAVVGEVAEGAQAVELARRLQPDLVLMDLNLPDMSGIAATRAIHLNQPQIRVIGLSMHEGPEQANAMRAAGAVAYVTKSGPVEELLAAMRGTPEPPRA